MQAAGNTSVCRFAKSMKFETNTLNFVNFENSN